MTTRDPDYFISEIKSKRKNRLVRAGRTEEATALANCIGKDILRHTKTRLSKVGAKANAKDMWTAVRRLTGRQQETAVIDEVTAESLNDHYATISTDLSYTPPPRKRPANPIKPEYILDWSVFKILDKLHSTVLMVFLPGSSGWERQLSANP